LGDLTNETIMSKVRSEKGIGSVIPGHLEYMGIAAKSKVAKLLDVSIHSVDLYEMHIEG